MQSPLIRAALFTWFIAILVYFIKEQGYISNAKVPEYIALAGVGMVLLAVISWLYTILISMKQRSGKNRCIRCGKRVEHGMIYCSKHLREAKDEAAEKQRERFL
ncbi:hypothetical protein JW905_04840 [bacterium]|nr:hypothetical protein [candidate division CSSED10-310 bacterium]